MVREGVSLYEALISDIINFSIREFWKEIIKSIKSGSIDKIVFRWADSEKKEVKCMWKCELIKVNFKLTFTRWASYSDIKSEEFGEASYFHR